MKHLAISALFLVLCPGAQAIDYVKCEAIAKTSERLYTSTFTEIASKDYLDYLSGANRLERQNNELINSFIDANVKEKMTIAPLLWGTSRAKEIPPQYRSYAQKMSKLQRDYKKYGCT